MIIERQSVVDAPTEQVWSRVVTPEGINDELRPWMTMSMPRGAESLTVDNIQIGTPIGRCWMRFFGVVPFDYANVELYTRRLTWVDTLSSAVRCMTSRPIFVPSADSGRGLSSYLEEA
jgi:hypothetical protein